jgi:hypothetical protein
LGVGQRFAGRASVGGEKVIFCLLVLSYLFPLWAFRYIPTQDGPSHLANAEIMKKYDDAGAERLRAFFVLNIKPIPNLLYHLLLAGLLYVFRPLLAEKILLSAYVIIFAFALRALGKAAGGRAGPAAFLVFPIIFSYPFQMGFFGFMFSLAVGTFGIAYYWRRRDEATPWLFVTLNVLGMLIFFFHLLGWVVFMGGVILLAWLAGAREALVARRSGGSRAVPRRRLFAKLAVPLYLVPAGAWGLYYVLGRPNGFVDYRGAAWLIKYMYRLETFRALGPSQKWLATAVAVTFGAVVVAALAVAVYRFVKRESRPAEGGGGAGWVWGAAVIAALALYSGAPDAALSGGFISNRLALLPLIAASAWLAAMGGRFQQKALFVVAPALALAYVATVGVEYRNANEDLKEFNTGRCYLTGDATFLSIICVREPRAGYTVKYMDHAGSYYTLGTYNVDLLNYEAYNPCFAVNWRCGSLPIGVEGPYDGTPIYVLDGFYDEVDYLICWRVNPFLSGMRKILARYRLVHSTTHMMILRRRDLGP